MSYRTHDPLFDEIAADLISAELACFGARLRLKMLYLPEYIEDKDPLNVLKSIKLAQEKTRSARSSYPKALRKYKKQLGV